MKKIIFLLSILISVYGISCTKIPPGNGDMTDQEKTEETVTNGSSTTTNDNEETVTMEDNNTPSNSQRTAIPLEGKCRFGDRKTVQIIENVEAIVGKAGNEVVVLPVDKEQRQSTRYFLCPAVKDIKQGQRVFFSGEVKEIKPTERLVATPIVITELYQ